MMMVKLTMQMQQHVAALADAEGCITPEAVVEAARPEDAPLHGLFPWDDKVAADKYRLMRARAIIRSVVYLKAERHYGIAMPNFIRDGDRPPREAGYRSIDSMQGRPDLARKTVLSELSRVRSYLTRAQNIARALGLDQEFDLLMGQIAGLETILNGESSPASGDAITPQ
jgi:hypothetical protein